LSKDGVSLDNCIANIMTTNTIHNTKIKRDIVCFAGCDWWYHNRGLFCPQIMKRLAKDYNVLFVNSLGIRVPSLKRDKHAVKKIFRKFRSMIRFLRKMDNGMYVFTPLSMPFLGNTLWKKFNTFFLLFQVKVVMTLLKFNKPIFYIGCVPALEIVKKLNRQYLIYERTDLFEEMPGTDKNYIASMDRDLAESADLVLYVNRALWDEGIKKNRNSVLIGHGVDFELFARAEESPFIPEDIANIPKPIVGFFGEISAKTSDFTLLEHIARQLPGISLVLVGPISADIRRLKTYKNVYFLGQKKYEEIPHYGKVFDVAIMPWNRNKWIEFCNPVKTKEYLALGRPIVSMHYPEIEPYSDIVFVAKDYDEFVSMIRQAQAVNDQQTRLEQKKRVQNETWDSKVEQIKAVIEKDLANKC
jgi:glycosyltransferase involved in cell wall biosynthesis